MPSDDKPKVNGTVTIDVSMPSLESKEKVSRILVKTGHNFKINHSDVIIHGKGIDTQDVLSELEEVDPKASIQRIEEDVVHKTEIKLDDSLLCCENNAEMVKSKLGAVEGINDVSANVNLKKVTVEGDLNQEEVLEAASKIGEAYLWASNNTEVKFPELCCESQGKALKSKLEGVEGISEVIVDAKGKRVTVKSNLSDRQVLEAAERAGGTVEIWK